MVGHVQGVSIFMIVHGALTFILGGIYVCIGPLMLIGVNQDRTATAEDKQVMPIVSAVMFGCGALVLIIGLLNVSAGIRCLGFRGRSLALIAVFSNVPVLCSGYCAVTGLGLIIYGLIVFLNADVAEAFAMRERGRTPDEIRAEFAPRRRYERFRDDDADDYPRSRRRDEDHGRD
jgi:hypothetical protein